MQATQHYKASLKQALGYLFKHCRDTFPLTILIFLLVNYYIQVYLHNLTIIVNFFFTHRKICPCITRHRSFKQYYFTCASHLQHNTIWQPSKLVMASVWRAMDSESVQASVGRVAIVGMYPQFNKSNVWDCTGLEAKKQETVPST